MASMRFPCPAPLAALALLTGCASLEEEARTGVWTRREPVPASTAVTVHVGANRGAPARVLLFDSADTFTDLRRAVDTRVLGDEHDRCSFDDIAPGRYAVCVFVDENGNGVLDRSFLGIPVEPVGFSSGYEPKGPPTFELAAFDLAADEAVDLGIAPVLPLGKYGRIGVGPGVLVRSSPYRGADGSRVNGIPAITFLNDRIAFLGPNVRVGVVGNDRARLAASLRYRFPAYEEDDSAFLAGLGDRDTTLMGGLTGIYEFGSNVDVELTYEIDLLDEIGGEAAALSIDKTFQWGRARISPGVALSWQSEELADHDFGVPLSGVAPGRPAYALSDILIPSVGVGTFLELSTEWRVLIDVNLDFLPSEVGDSPLIDEDTVLSAFFAVSYVF